MHRPFRNAEAEDICAVCGSGEQDVLLLLCDSCNCAYHTFCLMPRLRAVPAGDWFCPDCQSARPTQPEARVEARVEGGEEAEEGEEAEGGETAIHTRWTVSWVLDQSAGGASFSLTWHSK